MPVKNTKILPRKFPQGKGSLTIFSEFLQLGEGGKKAITFLFPLWLLTRVASESDKYEWTARAFPNYKCILTIGLVVIYQGAIL